MILQLLETNNVRYLYFFGEVSKSDFKPHLDLAINLQLLYELDYKYFIIKSKRFDGLPKRKDNILSILEQSAKVLISHISQQLLPIFEEWLFNHPVDVDEWVAVRSPKGNNLDVGDLFLAFTDLKPMGFNEIQYADFNLNQQKELKKGLKLMKIDSDRSINGTLKRILYLHSKKLPTDGGPFKDLYELIGAVKFSKIIKEFYRYVLYPMFMKKFGKGFLNSVKRIKGATSTLKQLSRISKIGEGFSKLNHIINIAHTTGSMLTFVTDTYTNVTPQFLKNLSNSDTKEWDNELRELGVLL